MFIYSMKPSDILISYFPKNYRENSPLPTEDGLNGTISFETDRQSDAMAVQRAFATNQKV